MNNSGDINININANTGDAEKNIKAFDKTVSNTASNISSIWRTISTTQNQALSSVDKSLNANLDKIKQLNAEWAKLAIQAGAKDWLSSLRVSSNIFSAPMPTTPAPTPKAPTQIGGAAWSSAFNAIDATKAQQLATQNAQLSSTANNVIKAYQQLPTSINQVIQAEQELAKTTKQTTSFFDKNITQLPRLRYALYDVANITGKVSSGIFSVGKELVDASVKYETAFTDIERTTMANSRRLELMNFQFKELARNMPLAFADVTRIGSLGAQMNIANSDLQGFTKTVAQFAATTNVSIDSAAQSFGALSNLMNVPADQFNNLGSAIAYVGINSVATESEVLSVATAIAGVAAQAGISKEYMIGLSGALASLRVPSEQSRGALTRIFQEINRASAEGGQAIQNFGNVVGMAGTDVQTMLSKQGGMEQFFQLFVSGLNGLNSEQLTTTLDALSLSDIRVTNVLARLSSNMDVVNQSLSNSNYGFQNGTILSQLYAKKAEDLQSKFTELSNSVQEFAASLGDALSPVIGSLVDWAAGILNGLSDALSTDMGKGFATFITIMGLLVGTLAAVITGLITATAAAAAMKTILSILGIEDATTGFRGFIVQLFTAKVSMDSFSSSATVATRAAAGFKIALIGIPIIAAITGLIALSGAFTQAGESADIAFKNMIGSTSGLKTALEADAAAYQTLKDAGATQQELADKFTVVDLSAEAAKTKVGEYSTGVENMGRALDITIPRLQNLGNEFQNNTRIIGDNTKQWVTQSLLASDSFQKLFENSDFSKMVSGLTQVGFSLNDLVTIQASGGDTEKKMMQYIFDLQEKAYAKGIKIPVSVVKSDTTGDLTWINDVAAGWDWLGSDKGQGANMQTLLTSVQGLSGAWYLAGTAADQTANAIGDVGDSSYDASKQVDALAKKVYLLTDYASDLSSVWKRAFDIRFGANTELDKITSSWIKMRDEVKAAKDEIRNLHSEINGLSADKKLKEYWLSVAVAYGDTMRATQLRAEIGKVNEDIAGKTKKVGEEQAKTNKTLVGNSSAAIENRNTIRGMITDYQKYIESLAASGMSQEDLAVATEQARQDFINQATQLGFNRTQLETYTASFDDMKTAINKIPRNVTVEFDGDPALTALKEFEAKAKDSGTNAGTNWATGFASGAAKAARAATLQTELADLQAKYWRYGSQIDRARITQILEQLQSGNYSSGGYTGAGGKYDVAGIVHAGEYVIPREQVNQATGMPYFMSQSRSFAQGGFTGSNSPTVMMVELSPYDRNLLAQAGNVQLRLDGKIIAQNTNANNSTAAQRGSN